MENDVETVRCAYRVLDGKVNKIKEKWGDVNLKEEVRTQILDMLPTLVSNCLRELRIPSLMQGPQVASEICDRIIMLEKNMESLNVKKEKCQINS